MGWGVLHLFCRAAGARSTRPAVLAAEEVARKAGHQVVAVAMLGPQGRRGPHGARARPLARCGSSRPGSRRPGLEIVASYVSLTELSEYSGGIPDEMKQARLWPQLPPEGKSAWCFYPMSKRRAEGHNWYALPFEDRKALMYGHGAVGRTFHGRILQLITGSTGLDDWEWGVTLFGANPDDLKDCVHKMRFDEASAHYAEFGPFYTGMVAELDAVLDAVGGPAR